MVKLSDLMSEVINAFTKNARVRDCDIEIVKEVSDYLLSDGDQTAITFIICFGLRCGYDCYSSITKDLITRLVARLRLKKASKILFVDLVFRLSKAFREQREESISIMLDHPHDHY